MVRYQWRELELISKTTISNIISFIQFAIIPLDLVESENEAQEEGASIDKIEKFISINFKPIAKLFTAPFDLVRSYNSISAPVRAALSATIIFAAIGFLYTTFFLPSWRFILFLLDSFMPAALLFGIIFINKNYEEQRNNAIILIVIGIIYLVGRIIYFISPLFKRGRVFKWYIKCSYKISEIFLSRLKKDVSDDELDTYTKEINDEIDAHEYNIQFDDMHFPFKKRLIDLSITFVLWIILLVFLLFGWRKVLDKAYAGKQLDDLTKLVRLINIILIVGLSLRILFSCLWLLRPTDNKFFQVFYSLKELAYKGVLFLTDMSLLPILKMVLSASATTEKSCGWYQYYDFRYNTESFLQYFMARKGTGCVNCSKYSANFVSPCNSTCYYDPNINPLTYKVLIDSPHISETELTDVYLVPTVLLEIYFLAIFLQILRQIYCGILDILVNLPGPTKNIECKFQTLIFTLPTAGVGNFQTYRYKSALFSYSFTQCKLFILFLTSLLTVIPIEILKRNSKRIIPWIYFISNAVISFTQIYATPYISILHNIVNFVSHIVGAIAALLVGLHVSQIIVLPTFVGNIIFVFIVITPIATALITPFFARRDKLLVPTEFNLLKIIYWDEKLKNYLLYKIKKSGVLNNNNDDNDNAEAERMLLQEEEPSLSISYFKRSKKKKESEDSETHYNFVNNFNMIKLAPIEVQEGIQYHIPSDLDEDDETVKDSYFKSQAKKVWPRLDIDEEEFDVVTNEMISLSSKLIDSICYNNIMRLINLSIIIASACLGWSLSSGIVQWSRVLGPNGDNYYLRCNMFNNGTYPPFGSY